MLLEQILLTAAIIGTFVSLLFILSVLIKRNDIADIAWGTGILIVAVTSYFHSADRFVESASDSAHIATQHQKV